MVLLLSCETEVGSKTAGWGADAMGPPMGPEKAVAGGIVGGCW